MNIAIIGDGRTGQQVVKLLQSDTEHQISGIYNSRNPVSVEALQQADVAIVFVPPTVIESLIPVLLAAKIDVVCGTTGYEWPQSLREQVASNNNRWVCAHNFSLAMNLMRHCLGILGKSGLLLGNPQYQIEEVHHTKKLDSPSGTAISWRDWLAHDCEINAIREGDVIGIHELKLETEFEKIQLRHESKDRALFGQGAIWAAVNLISQPPEQVGFVPFSTLVDQHLGSSNGQTTGGENVSI
ncbi:MAG: 4-hydroxy-tetrahydrodipicolinate reductase [Phenylobacterium sp.]|jgi:4-hydroxy-tetrahydrodipicolinate reductase